MTFEGRISGASFAEAEQKGKRNGAEKGFCFQEGKQSIFYMFGIISFGTAVCHGN